MSPWLTPRDGQRGNTLVSVLVAVAIFGIVISAVSSMMAFNARTLVDIEKQSDLEDMRRWLGSAVDCPLTRASAGGSCPATPVRKGAYRASATGAFKIIEGTGPYTRIGDYEVRMLCRDSAPMQLQFQVRRVNGSPASWEKLFPKVPFRC